LFKSVQSLLMGKQESGSSRKTEADREVWDWPQKLNSIIDNHRDHIEIKDTTRDLHNFALSLWISLVTSIAVWQGGLWLRSLKTQLFLPQVSATNPTPHDRHRPDDHLSGPALFIILWIHWELVKWICRLFLGHLAIDGREDCGSEVWRTSSIYMFYLWIYLSLFLMTSQFFSWLCFGWTLMNHSYHVDMKILNKFYIVVWKKSNLFSKILMENQTNYRRSQVHTLIRSIIRPLWLFWLPAKIIKCRDPLGLVVHKIKIHKPTMHA
jgi:hypothetical protein